MVKTYKFGEESKLISFRVPKTQHKIYRQKIQHYIDGIFNDNIILMENGNKDKILQLLQFEQLTIHQIGKRITIVDGDRRKNENNIRTYVHRLLKDDLIHPVGNRKRNRIFTANKFNKNEDDLEMTRKPLKELKNKTIQIRVSENTFNQFENLCYNKHNKTISEIGFKLIQNFLNGTNSTFKLKEKKEKIPLGYEEFPNDFYQSDEWILRSIEILKRDEWKCQLQGSDCLEIGNIVHHIRSAKHYPKICLDPKNLVCACRNCHDQLYKNYF